MNRRLDLVEPSKSVTLLAKAKAMQAVDPTVINMTAGEPDFPTPQPICDVVTAELAKGNTHYSDPKGNPSLRNALAKKLNEENGAPFTADDILVTPGAKYAVFVAIQALLNEGDEALWLTPGWVSYPSMVQIAGGVPKAIHLKYEDNYSISYDLLAEQASEKTKLLIINFPNNPTGKILSDKDMEELKRFLRDYPQVIVISDEIYEKIIYDGNVVKSIAADPEFFERTIVINGFSKASAMTGWRIGYLACAPALYKYIMKIYQHSISCVSVFLQEGAVKALECVEETEAMRVQFEKRRNILVEGLNKIPGVEFVAPEGAFYAWVKFDTDLDSETVCNRLLDEAGIAGVPGGAYGEEGVCCVRFSFATSEDVIRKMIDKLMINMNKVLY
ncbi:MAG: pyridoxal phosphate-dependent aminotransferase [Eubacterium sp.]|nr:pyridoxal phosphate-dependent aminotransferase [Candidatus Colimonas fimequi]